MTHTTANPKELTQSRQLAAKELENLEIGETAGTGDALITVVDFEHGREYEVLTLCDCQHCDLEEAAYFSAAEDALESLESTGDFLPTEEAGLAV